MGAIFQIPMGCEIRAGAFSSYIRTSTGTRNSYPLAMRLSQREYLPSSRKPMQLVRRAIRSTCTASVVRTPHRPRLDCILSRHVCPQVVTQCNYPDCDLRPCPVDDPAKSVFDRTSPDCPIRCILRTELCPLPFYPSPIVNQVRRKVCLSYRM